MPETPNGRPIAWGWLVAALVLGAAAGALDLVEREVQGPLLVLMASAFVVALPRRAPAWAVGLAASLGLPLAHAVAAIRGGEPPSWGMLLAVLPTLFAAYAGAFASRLVETAARGIPRDAKLDFLARGWVCKKPHTAPRGISARARANPKDPSLAASPAFRPRYLEPRGFPSLSPS